MSGPDRPNEPEWPINRADRDAQRGPIGHRAEPRTESFRRDADTTVARGRRSRGNWPILAALGGLLLLLFLAWFFTGNRSPDQDKLTGNSSQQASASDPEKLCASSKTYDAIKRDLFRRAAQIRGSDQSVYDRLSGYATLRMENPVMENQDEDSGAVNCSGTLYLDLPPSVQVVGGRRTLSADVDYTVRSAADKSGTVVLLKNADAVITPLATLGRTGSPPPQQTAETEVAAQPQIDQQVPAPRQPPAPAAAPAPAPEPISQPAEPRPSATARPSFNCANARTRGEIAVCADGGLASLDRQMASQYVRSVRAADPSERALLQRTRNRFLSYRDSCRSDACIADAYRGRIREINDIMGGRWRP